MIEPAEVFLSPTLPKGEPAQCLFEIINKSNQTIEVYSLDWDPQILLEEKMLRQAEGYNEKNLLYLEPRDAGQKFWPSISEQYNKQVQGDSKLKSSTDTSKSKSADSEDKVIAQKAEDKGGSKKSGNTKLRDDKDQSSKKDSKEDQKPKSKRSSTNQSKESHKGWKVAPLSLFLKKIVIVNFISSISLF